MKILLLISSFLMLLSGVSAQQGTDKLRQLYAEEKLDEIINQAGTKTDWDAKGLYYIGMAYYRKADDVNALKYLDLAIAKGPVDHDMYYYKGRVLAFTRKHAEGLAFVDKAIALLPNEPDFYAGKAHIYNEMAKPDSAVFYYEKAIALPGCKIPVMIELAEYYIDRKDMDNGLRVFNVAVSRMNPADEEYQTTLYNIGLVQALTGKHKEARQSFATVVKAYPNDYRAVAKLIQEHNAIEEYAEATALKPLLYDAWKKDSLPEEMRKMFCIDQFTWNKKRVMAFENFEDTSSKFLLVKHQFFVLDEKGNVEYQVRSESSPAVRMGGKDSKYVLCLVREGSFQTYWNYIFNDSSNYGDTRKAVIAILDGKSKPSASTTTGGGKKDD